MATVLTIDERGEGFRLDGRPGFLLAASYFGALAASEDFIEDDLAELKTFGFNGLRVWVRWAAFAHDVSAVDDDGDEREPYFGKLLWLCEFADKLSLVVDVTISRGAGPCGPGLPTDETHLNAAAVLAESLKARRNVTFDLANERNVQDGRHVGIPLVRRLRNRVKEIDPDRLVTASHAGDIEPDRLYEYITSARVDYLAPHRPRVAGSAAETAQKVANLRRRMARLGKVVPVHCQEPFRRGLGPWQPATEDFLADLAGAATSGAAGWCFHNGCAADHPERRPRRCFDMRGPEGRLVEQLEDPERAVLRHAAKVARGPQ